MYIQSTGINALCHAGAISDAICISKPCLRARIPGLSSVNKGFLQLRAYFKGFIVNSLFFTIFFFETDCTSRYQWNHTRGSGYLCPGDRAHFAFIPMLLQVHPPLLHFCRPNSLHPLSPHRSFDFLLQYPTVLTDVKFVFTKYSLPLPCIHQWAFSGPEQPHLEPPPHNFPPWSRSPIAAQPGTLSCRYSWLASSLALFLGWTLDLQCR